MKLSGTGEKGLFSCPGQSGQMSGTSGQIAGQFVLFTGQPLDTGRTFVRLVQTPDRHGTRLSVKKYPYVSPVSMSKSRQVAISNKMKNSINQHGIHHRLGGNKGDALIFTKRATLPLRVRQSPTEGDPPAALVSPNQAGFFRTNKNSF